MFIALKNPNIVAQSQSSHMRMISVSKSLSLLFIAFWLGYLLNLHFCLLFKIQVVSDIR